MTAKLNPITRKCASLSATIAIIGLVPKIEPEQTAAMDWSGNIPIAEPENLSARQLVNQGERTPHRASAFLSPIKLRYTLPHS
jgi:hypothetical protein